MFTVNELKKIKNNPVEIAGDFTYTAHTGCLGTKDNSLESIDVGVEYGAQIVEVDVQYYNGVPVLSHDAPHGDEIPLKEAFLKVKKYENLRVNVDIKSVEFLSEVQKIAEETGVLDRIFFTGIFEKDIETVKSSCPKIQYYLNVSVLPKRKQTIEYLEAIAEKVESCGAIGINFNKDNATPELVNVFHKKGLLVSIWTVNHKRTISKILSYGPDNITTRRPDKLKEVLKGIRSK